MAQERRMESPVTLFAAIEEKQYEVLRTTAFERNTSIAALVREVLAAWIADLESTRPVRQNGRHKKAA